MRTPRFTAGMIAIILLGIVVPVIGVALIRLFLPDWSWTHIPFHSVVEGLGAFMALVLAGLLLMLRKFGKEVGHSLWISCSLIGMGMLDGFHAVVLPGNTFVWLHSVATFVGGFFFVLIWLPERLMRPRLSEAVPKWVAVATLSLGVASIAVPDALPVMVVSKHAFTSTARGLNGIGGILFLIAAGRFIADFRTRRSWDEFLFATLCSLFGAAGVLFTISELWDGTWWLWHLLRLLAYSIVLSYSTVIYRRAEDGLRKTNRALKTLSECNQALVHAANESGLIREICRIIVEVGEYRLAWVGFADRDEEKTVRPVAQCGYEEGYLETVRITWADTERGAGPTGTAIRTSKPSVVQNIPVDPRYKPWRADAMKRGYASSIALPLVDGDRAFGALNIYAVEPNAFHTEEVNLLVELTNDLAYGIASLRMNDQRVQVEQALSASEEQFRRLVESAPDGIVISDSDGKIVMVNSEAERIFNYGRTELRGKPVEILVPERFRDIHVRHRSNYYSNPTTRPMGLGLNLVGRRRDGTEFPVEIGLSTLESEKGMLVTSIIRDITERKRAEQETGLLQTLSLAIAESKDFESAVRCVLRMVCEATGWVLAEAWVPSSDGSCLNFMMIWYENGDAQREFERTSGEMTFAMGVGLPGRVWKSKKPEWIPDVSVNGQTFLRAKSALKAGLRSGVGVPIVAEDEVLAVLVFFMTQEREEDKRFVDLISSVAAQLGLVFRSKRAEEALRASERQLSLVYDNVADIIFYLAVESGNRFRFLSINPAFLKATRLSENQVVGKLVIEVIPEPSLTMVLGKYKEAIREKKTVQWEETSVYPSGTKHGEVSVTPIFNEKGHCTNLIGTVHDITERKQAEEALQQSEEQYRTVTESVNDAIIAIDQHSRIILFANNSVEKIFGYTPSELLGKEITVLMPDRFRDLHRASVKRYTETGLRHLNWKSTQFPGLHKSGKEIPLEISYGEYTKGGKRYFIGVVRDISERVQAEEALRNAEKRYRTTLDHMLEGCQIIGFDWRYLYINDVAAKQGRRTKEELLGRTMMEMYPGIENAPFFADLRRCMEERIPHRMENEFTFPDGTKGWFQLSMEPVPEGVFILSEDITKQKQLDEELRKHREHLEDLVKERTFQLEAANKELEAFSYSVSHDLRAPLRHIDGFIEILRKRTWTSLDEQTQRHLSIISDSARKMGTLIDDLLAFSRMSRVDMMKTRVNLEKLVESVRQDLRHEMEGREITWEIRSLPEVEGDPSMLRVVLTNLISNALKFTRTCEESRIEIGCNCDAQHETVFFVRDNGVGFDKQYADKLFGVFQRLHRADEYEGTGIGLATCRRIINRHGGRIWAEGAIGRGATFYFSLPKPQQKG